MRDGFVVAIRDGKAGKVKVMPFCPEIADSSWAELSDSRLILPYSAVSLTDEATSVLNVHCCLLFSEAERNLLVAIGRSGQDVNTLVLTHGQTNDLPARGNGVECARPGRRKAETNPSYAMF